MPTDRVEFQRDPLAAEHADRRHYGLNIAVAWPLGAAIEEAYGEFARRASGLHDGLYVYPFATTHVTVLTAVDFKSHADPSAAEIADIDRAAERLGAFVAGIAGDFTPFSLDVGRPVLVSRAAFLPLANPSGEIARVRQRALAFCNREGGVLAGAFVPRAIHSTVLRFRETPPDPLAFADAFDDIARTTNFGTIAVDRLLVTLETKPYMREGRVVRSVDLRRPHDVPPFEP